MAELIAFLGGALFVVLCQRAYNTLCDALGAVGGGDGALTHGLYDSTSAERTTTARGPERTWRNGEIECGFRPE